MKVKISVKRTKFDKKAFVVWIVLIIAIAAIVWVRGWL